MPTEDEGRELLRAIAKRRAVTADGQISYLAERVRDWDSLLQVANQHRVLPLLFSRLQQTRTAAPPDAQERLQSAYQRNVFHCLANAAELIAVLKVFTGEGISAMPLKGVVLAASVYGDLTARAAGDLDILVYRRDRDRATAALRKCGYELRTPVSPDGTPDNPDSYEYHFERAGDGMVTELRWRFELIQPRFRRDLGMDWVWPRRKTAILAGADVPDLDPEIKLLMLCMHGCKHRWARLLWICDVAQLLTSCPALDWNQVNREARRTGLWRSLALGVLLAHRAVDAEVPPAVLQRFQSDAAARGLARHFNDRLFDAPGSLPTTLVPYSLQLLGLRDRIGLLLSLDLLRPSARDEAAVKLPKWLHGLHYLIRPFRLLRDRSPR